MNNATVCHTLNSLSLIICNMKKLGWHMFDTSGIKRPVLILISLSLLFYNKTLTGFVSVGVL